MSQSGYTESGNTRVHVHRLRVLNAQHVSIIKEIILSLPVVLPYI